MSDLNTSPQEEIRDGSPEASRTPAPETPETILRDAIIGWVAAAREERRHIRMGIALAPSVNLTRARTYMRAARSLKIEQQTGVAVCACCFKPFSVHHLSHREERALEARAFASSQVKIQNASSDLQKVADYKQARKAVTP